MRERVYVKSSDLLALAGQVRKDPDLFYIIGSYSISIPSWNTKYIDKSVVKAWPDLDGEVQMLTPSEAARMELNRAFSEGKKKLRFARKSDMELLDLNPPAIWASNHWSGDAYYIDLKGAYSQIYKHLWIDMVWPRGTGKRHLYPVYDRLKDWKQARNSVIGICRSKAIRVGKGAETWAREYRNPYLNPALWHTVQRVLHGIAYKSLESGAVYVATDGYIIPYGRKAKEFIKWLDLYQLEYRLVEGEAEIIGLGAYKVGPHRTNLYDKQRPVGNRGKVNNIKGFPETLETLSWFFTIRGY